MTFKWYWVVAIAAAAMLLAIGLQVRGKVPASVVSALSPKAAA